METANSEAKPLESQSASKIQVPVTEEDKKPTINELNSDHPRGDIDLFEKLFETWKSQNGKSETKEKDTMKALEQNEREHQRAKGRVEDLEKSVELLQAAMNSLHNDLNLLDEVSKEKMILKEQLSELKDVLKNKEVDFVTELDAKDLKFNELLAKHAAELDELKTEQTNEIRLRDIKVDETVKEKQEAIKKLEKENQSEIARLTVDYENKLAKVQRQKAVAVVNQQQSANQEIFRRKLQHLKSEYEQEVKSLKETVKQLQTQLSTQATREMSYSRASFTSNAKKMRKF